MWRYLRLVGSTGQSERRDAPAESVAAVASAASDRKSCVIERRSTVAASDGQS